ncbi:MAG: carboxypeptidase regulatory-like domain-containing protein [Anaerolineaceae bacterium]|nr:carboxypeptidase regulatory-like domain-containing protein [Anaerolineaceae bacterium]
MKPTGKIYFALIILTGWLLVACGQELPSMPAVQEPKFPLTMEEPTMQELVIKTICLDVSYAYQGAEPEVLPNKAVEQLLTTMGIVIDSPGGSCDASLTFDMKMETITQSYLGLGNCVVGGKVTGQLSFASPESTPILVEIENQEANAPNTITKAFCEMGSSAYVNIWKKPVLSHLVLLWGSEVIAAAMEDPIWDQTLTEWIIFANAADVQEELLPFLLWKLNSGEKKQVSSATTAIKGLGYQAKDAIPYLIYAAAREDIVYDEENWRDFLFRSEIFAALGKIGPAAFEAVPLISPHLKPEDYEGINHINEADVYALRRLTGEVLHNADDYKSWYANHLESWPPIIKGQVIRSDTSQPVENAVVALYSQTILPREKAFGFNLDEELVGLETFTDSQGNYQIATLPGEYTLFVSVRLDAEVELLCEFLPSFDLDEPVWTQYQHGKILFTYFHAPIGEGLTPFYTVQTQVTLLPDQPKTLDIDLVCIPS